MERKTRSTTVKLPPSEVHTATMQPPLLLHKASYYNELGHLYSFTQPPTMMISATFTSCQTHLTNEIAPYYQSYNKKSIK
jgi:hypothetical protein